MTRQELETIKTLVSILSDPVAFKSLLLITNRLIVALESELGNKEPPDPADETFLKIIGVK